ncbi:hypothetical protein HDU93_005533, partial [Gonapodya sp. JEL0774]
EVQRVVQIAVGSTRATEERLALATDRTTLHAASLARVATWGNTISGLRRQKLQARTERLRAEEEERAKLDREHAKEKEEKRAKDIERAKKIMYDAKDEVKTFHSKVLLYQVMEERDHQLKLKQQRKNISSVLNFKFTNEGEQLLANELVAEKEKVESQKLRRMQLAREQEKQMAEKKAHKEEENKARLSEGARARLAATVYQEQQRRLSAQRRGEAISIHEDLVRMLEEHKRELVQEAKRNDEENANVVAWAERKDAYNKAKRDAEKHWM